jgi:hypothetical protein
MIDARKEKDIEKHNSRFQPAVQNDMEEYNHEFMDVPRVVEVMIPDYEEETINCQGHKCKYLLVGFTVVFSLAIGILTVVLIVRSAYSSSHERRKINWEDPSRI